MQVMISLTDGIEKITKLESFKNVMELGISEIKAMFPDSPDAVSALVHAFGYTVSERAYDLFASPFCLQLENSTGVCTEEFPVAEENPQETLKQVSYNDWLDHRINVIGSLKDHALGFYRFKGMIRTKLLNENSPHVGELKDAGVDETFDRFYREIYTTYLKYKPLFEEKLGPALNILVTDLQGLLKSLASEETDNLKKFLSGDFKATFIVSL